MNNTVQLKAPYLLYLGNSESMLAVKTSRGIAQWRPELCVGEFKQSDCTVSLNLPSLTIAQALDKGAKTLIIGIANSGGYINDEWLADFELALSLGLDIASGLHHKLNDNQALVKLAKKYNRQLIDVRDFSTFRKIGCGTPRTGKRLLTVGTDCAVGKMYTALAIHEEMKKQNFNVDFRATGQSGIFIEGSGICVDAVIADFMSGAIEQLSPNNSADHWDIIEGQGSLFNPSFAGVSTALLHGAQPDYLVLCHEAERVHIKDLPNYPMPTIQQCIEQNLTVARLTNKAVKLIGISLNTRLLSEVEANQQMALLTEKYQVPCFDPMRTGVSALVEKLKQY